MLVSFKQAQYFNLFIIIHKKSKCDVAGSWRFHTQVSLHPHRLN